MQGKLLLRLLTWDARLAWSAAALPVLGLLAISHFECDSSRRWLYLGLLLQLIGIGLVAKGIGETRRRFGKPSLLGRILQWASAVKGAALAGRNQTLLAGTAHIAVSAGGVLVGSGQAIARTLEERVASLEAAEAALREFVSQVRTELAVTKQALTADLARESAKRSEELAKVRALLDEHAAGGLSLDAIAVFWLLVGTVASTIPDKLPSILVGCP